MFCDASLEYVFKIQEVQEKKKFEFVEPVRMRFSQFCQLAADKQGKHFNQVDVWAGVKKCVKFTSWVLPWYYEDNRVGEHEKSFHT